MPFEQIGGADEACDERRFRLLVDRARRSDLLDPAGAHHGDAVGDRERLLLVVRHVEHRDAEQLLQAADLAAHLDPQLGVEIGERLVEQQHVRLDHHRARDRDALELAAGQLMRPALAVAGELNQLERARDPFANFIACALCARAGRRRHCRRP